MMLGFQILKIINIVEIDHISKLRLYCHLHSTGVERLPIPCTTLPHRWGSELQFLRSKDLFNQSPWPEGLLLPTLCVLAELDVGNLLTSTGNVVTDTGTGNTTANNV